MKGVTIQVRQHDYRYVIWGSQLKTADGLAGQGRFFVGSPAAFGTPEQLQIVNREGIILWP